MPAVAGRLEAINHLRAVSNRYRDFLRQVLRPALARKTDLALGPELGHRRRIVGVKDIIGFHGETVAELTADVHHAIDHYLAVCAKRGEKPERPYSSKIMLRVSPEIHAAAAVAAEASGSSLNQWAAEALWRAAR